MGTSVITSPKPLPLVNALNKLSSYIQCHPCFTHCLGEISLYMKAFKCSCGFVSSLLANFIEGVWKVTPPSNLHIIITAQTGHFHFTSISTFNAHFLYKRLWLFEVMKYSAGRCASIRKWIHTLTISFSKRKTKSVLFILILAVAPLSPSKSFLRIHLWSAKIEGSIYEDCGYIYVL